MKSFEQIVQNVVCSSKIRLSTHTKVTNLAFYSLGPGITAAERRAEIKVASKRGTAASQIGS